MEVVAAAPLLSPPGLAEALTTVVMVPASPTTFQVSSMP